MLSVGSILSSESLDCFNDQFESLLQSHEEHRRSQQFDQKRLSIISTSSNHDLQNSSSLFQRKKNKDSKKKKQKKSRKPKQERKFRENDELEEVESRLETLQDVLKYLPEDSSHVIHDDPDNIEQLDDDDDFDAVCSGFLVVVGDNISEATRFYAELLNNVLYLRREPNGKVKQVITISFIQSTALDQEQESDEKNNDKQKEAQKEKIDSGKYVDLFLAHLESQSANHSFKLFSPTGIYVLSASCFRDKQRFSKCIEAELLKLFDNETWIAKIEACQQLQPVERAQFEIQIEQHEQILSSLTLTGLANNVGLLGSANKEKSGVMRILKHTHSHSYKHVSHSKKHNKWEDHFFVLAHATLYYFQHDPDKEVSQSSMPKSFIPLKYASIELDVERIKSDRFVFSISTPLRTVFLRCRHPIALAEWVSALYRAQRKALGSSSSGNNKDKDKDAKHVLEEIRVIRSKVATLHNLLRDKTGIKIFEEHLQSTQSSNLLRCWLAILNWKHNMSASKQVKRPTLLAKLNDGKHNAADKLPLAEDAVSSDAEEKKQEEEEEQTAAADGGGGDDAFVSAQKEAQMLFEQYINDTQNSGNDNNNIWKALDKDDYDGELIMECKRRVYLTKSAGNNLLSPSAAASTSSLSDVILKIIECFDEILDILDDTLNYEFEHNFVKTKPYTALQTKYDANDKFLPLPLDREIEDFPENAFIVLKCTNTDLSTKEIKLSTKKSVATIGRDCSNIIVLDDAHVSRSHARIEYDQRSAHFTDLGSHHGSFLNGSRVLCERLDDGDRLKLGGCDILFNVKTKKNFMNKMFGK